MEINERLSEYVNENGIKQVHIAQKTGINKDAISKMLSGSRRILANEFLMICDAINLDPNVFRNQTK